MIKVLKTGMLTTVQDIGRVGYRNIGVPLSGSMDSISAGIANGLLNNHKNDAVLEITMLGPKLAFLKAAKIAISGAELSAKINNTSIINNKVYFLKKGDVLSFGAAIKGIRCYLAVEGGFQTEKILKSRSFYAGITSQEKLNENDTIPFNSQLENTNNFKGLLKNKVHFFETNELEVYKGPEYDLFTPNEKKLLISNKFTVSKDSNRMGYRLEETVIEHTKSIITSPVIPGTVQLTPEGKLIILMKDAQTTGGYPRVLQLSEKSIAILAQKNAKDKISFKKMVSI
ncbi:5-oxoprolinase subunit C family protein [Lutibacter flavus]|uniref:Biotin-dependent carboxylase uncharacterized domain-containing protein n=1 Tax=Lutibacter flavus TaxID=691689 RepID=A0A238VLN1_9FLAO|nr:biotin-dependent carboxyltransferase family protein [Lutibacter flavus]SNR34409.1 biotin-dependent carboxylase uncharacterized domain-containing protein [Lutibacter flavus]